MAGDEDGYVARTRAFFGPRAATWNSRFSGDEPAYEAAVCQAGIRRGGVVLDAGCGTGRALTPLRQAVGADGTVIALDLTPEMLARARQCGARAAYVMADVRRIPLAGGCVDAVFAAGLVAHLPDIAAGLCELARVTRRDGLLILFHPSGRAALAARHGRVLQPDEPLAETPLRRSLQASGWRLATYDDSPHHFYAIATRT